MKAWKWTMLLVTGGVLVQLGGCAPALLYSLLDVTVSQLVTRLMAGLTGGAL